MVFLSETTKLEMNWLFLDHEVSSDTMLVTILIQHGSSSCYKFSWSCGSNELAWYRSMHRTAEYYLNQLDLTVQVLDCIQLGVLVVSLDGLQSIKGNNLPGSLIDLMVFH